MGQSVCKGKNCEDCTCCPITAEDIHRVLAQVYGVVTDCKKSFEERKKLLCCYQDKYKCFINPFFPHYVQFKKDCYGYEYLILIATVKKFAIDVVLYWDLQDWIVLNSGTCYRHYYTGGCSKLEKSVAVRKPLKGEYGRIYEAKKRQIKCILNKQCEKKKESSCSSSSSSSSSCSSSSSSSSCEKKKCKKPEIKITYPKNHAKVGCDFCLKFEVKNLGKHCLEWCWAGKKGGKVKKCNEVKIHLEKAKKGWNCVELKLVDKCGKVVACKKQKFYLCKDCCHSSSSSSSCSSSSSSSWCGKCKSSSSSCGCDSSSSSSSCSSSSSSSDCFVKDSYCDSSSSSSSCSSSSSSSWCGKCKSSSSSCGCDSSSSSSSSSWCGKCKSSSSSCGCDSSSSSSSCSSSSSSSSSSSVCVNPYDKKYSVSCGGYGWNKNHGSYNLKKRFEKCDSSSSSSSSCSSSSSSSSCDKKRIYWKRK
ncbi:Hypothetical protein BQ3484_557 [Cedratvirus A11]|uniref:Uncharacterized protein n=1 Tax=Cedratvirus A11 TaxID=1903266 RepID=A0A1M7XVA5_9VIRU|nr:Hypothetical protein BQ3484_557 [Cedratvirus A11]SHO33625.1 Hypothetical protein BQ3484_557 [Cedratvirus A11]